MRAPLASVAITPSLATSPSWARDPPPGLGTSAGEPAGEAVALGGPLDLGDQG